jgi:predicted RNase H-like nuclease (RuvC/YqgF family)
MLRENTSREDHLKRIERENKQLKEDLKESQKNVEKLMEYLGVAEAAMEGVGADKGFERRGGRR